MSPLKGHPDRVVRGHFIYLLTSMPADLLKALIHGDLEYQKTKDTGLKEVLDTFWDRRNVQPAIYQFSLVTKSGLCPDTRVLQELITTLRLYCNLGLADDSRNNVIYEIDSWKKQPLWKEELLGILPRRKYLQSASDLTPSEKRIATVLLFCDTLEQRIRDHEHKGSNLPMPALTEIGYSAHPGQRIQQHCKHQRSNYVMNLVESIMHVKYRGRYRMAASIICPLFEPDQASYGEILFSRLCGSYTYTGTGFNSHPAALSTGSAGGFNSAAWELYILRAAEKSPLMKNIDEELLRKERFEQQYKELEQLCEDVVTRLRNTYLDDDWL